MSAESSREQITDLLVAHGRGDQKAFDRLVELVYRDLYKIAQGQLRKNVRGTLDTTGLVHEAYIRLVDGSRVSFSDSSHFFAAAAQVMRWIVVDRARKASAKKRGGCEPELTLDSRDLVVETQSEKLIDLNRALEALSEVDERLTRIVECRFFAGLGMAESAKALGVSLSTANRDWARAKAWLLRELRSRVGATE